MKSVAIAAVLVCALAGSAEARDLGERGAISVNGAFTLNITSTSTDQTNSDSTTEVRVSPNGDLFVIPNVSIGGGLSVDYAKTGNASSTAFGLEGRAGYYLPIGSAGIWLQVAVAYDHGKEDLSSSLGSLHLTTDVVALQVYVPLVVHLGQGFFIGLGPLARQDISYSDDSDLVQDVKKRVLGITSLVGGVW